MKYLRLPILVPFLILMGIQERALRNYRLALELKPSANPTTVTRDSGTITWNPKEKYHLLIGYDVDNCKINGAPNDSVIANGNFYVDSGFRGDSVIELNGTHNNRIDTVTLLRQPSPPGTAPIGAGNYAMLDLVPSHEVMPGVFVDDHSTVTVNRTNGKTLKIDHGKVKQLP